MKISKLLVFRCVALAFFVHFSTAQAQTAPDPLEWPTVTRENKPWTRWWWMGSAVDERNLTATLERYEEAGLGGVEITPIYGVAGYEDRFVDYLSPAWMDRLVFTLEEAGRLDLGVDMATGTGWPFGGPWVDADDASRYVARKTYTLRGGERLEDPVRYRQEPILRAVGNQIYEIHGFLKPEGEAAQGTMEQPLQRPDTDRLDINQLKEPIRENANLQALALDQVRFPHDMPLQALMAYSDAGAVRDLTDRVDGDGRLDWVAPAGEWTLYAVFQGWHGKMVERAAPGGEGPAIDHFSERAIENYLQPFDEAFEGRDISALRGFFNDSYEVDDASGEADWTPAFFEAFEARRGYDLRAFLPALFGEDTEDRNRRVLTDYRHTLSELLLDHFTEKWTTWANNHGAITRDQAHGSPGNILDLYAASDIPETEGADILRAKFASSAAHVTGKPLASSESATWLNEHFSSNLADVKKNLDRYFLSGVNHVFYHGTAYAPLEAPWPGWLFYAAVHFSPANPLWTDFGALNNYVARSQSILQAGEPDNDVLLYLPMADRYAERGRSLLVHVNGMEPFEGMGFEAGAELLQERGYAFDFISDRQLLAAQANGDIIRTAGGGYRTVVVPAARSMPVETLEKLLELAEAGATVIVHNELPEDVPGLGDLDHRRAAFLELIGRLRFDGEAGIRTAELGEGRVLLGDDLEALLTRAGVSRERMIDEGLEFVRRGRSDGADYFVANWGGNRIDGWVPLSVEARAVGIFDPKTGKTGLGDARIGGMGGAEVYLQLDPGETTILRTYTAEVQGPAHAYYEPTGATQELRGEWTIRFVKGGPSLPAEIQANRLASWTDLGGEDAKSFSGTATYTIAFQKPGGSADGWLLDLGEVRESARVRLNGRDLGTLIGPNYRLPVDAALLMDRNTLEIDVSNGMANRIAEMDREKAPWKRFYNINFPAQRRENRNERGLFDASGWEPAASGLIGPVTLTPARVFATK